MSVAALFCLPRSVYRSIPDVDVYDAKRDALTFPLDRPVVAHPPCRSWGRFSHRAQPRPGEHDLAWWALHVVRHCGGVLEHPITSRLWELAGVGTPGVRDRFGGVFVPVYQCWWGHRAVKATGLYVVGAQLADVPAYHDRARQPVANMGAAERMRTPAALAAWLVSVARGARV